MTELNSAVTITRADLESGHWTKACLTMRFKPCAFDAAGELIEIAETSGKIILGGLGLDEARLLEAYVNRHWGELSERVFFVHHYLGENPSALERFMDTVVPHLELGYVGTTPDWNDYRLSL